MGSSRASTTFSAAGSCECAPHSSLVFYSPTLFDPYLPLAEFPEIVQCPVGYAVFSGTAITPTLLQAYPRDVTDYPVLDVLRADTPPSVKLLPYGLPHSAHSLLLISRWLDAIKTCVVATREAGPASEIPPANKRQLLARESCSSFLYYATGSRRCSGVLIKISLTKRHDLFMLLWNLVSPVLDRVTVEVGLDDDDMEPMVFAVTRKRDVKKLLQDVPHLQDFVGITRATSLPPGLVCLSETPALLDPLLQPHAVKILSENSDLLELMHFTDQNEEPILGQAQTPRKALRFVFRLPVDSGGKSGDNSGGTKMIELAVHYIELLHK